LVGSIRVWIDVKEEQKMVLAQFVISTKAGRRLDSARIQIFPFCSTMDVHFSPRDGDCVKSPLRCHPRESGDPYLSSINWIPTFVGMTKPRYWFLHSLDVFGTWA
jgi:hypothetical protein